MLSSTALKLRPFCKQHLARAQPFPPADQASEPGEAQEQHLGSLGACPNPCPGLLGTGQSTALTHVMGTLILLCS